MMSFTGACLYLLAFLVLFLLPWYGQPFDIHRLSFTVFMRFLPKKTTELGPVEGSNSLAIIAFMSAAVGSISGS
jgi:hypothetical protein